MAYNRINPYQEEWLNLLNATLIYHIAQWLGIKKVGGGSFRPEDFILSIEDAEERQPDINSFRKLVERFYGNNRKPGR